MCKFYHNYETELEFSHIFNRSPMDAAHDTFCILETMAAARAGMLPQDSDLRAEVVFRRGEMAKNPRKGESRELRFSMNEGFAVLRQKIMRFFNQAPFSSSGIQMLDPDVYFKESKNAPQSTFKRLDDTNFAILLQARWSKITQADVDKVASGETRPRELGKLMAIAFSFQFFVYVSAPISAQATSLRRATASRIAESAQAVAEFSRQQEYVGPITTNHLVVTHARQPEGTPVEFPDDNTTRQARALDDIIRRTPTNSPNNDPESAEIEVQIGGAWVRLRVKIASLRAALNLPQHDIFSRGIFHGFTPVPPAPLGEDVQDLDHMQGDEVERVV